EAVKQARRDPRAHEMRDVAAERADLLDEARGDELEAVGGHQEHGLDPRIEPGVHAGHLELVFEIRHRTQPADDDAGFDRLGEAHQQAGKGAHLDALDRVRLAEMGDLVAYDLDPLVGREQRPLAVIAGDPDDQPIDDMQGSADDVGMAIGDRVEGTGVDPDATAHLFSPSPLPSEAASPVAMPGSSPPFPLSPSLSGPSPLDPSPFSSATSGSLATETTRSPSPTRKT